MPARPGGPVRGSRALPAAGFHELGELTFGHRKTIGCSRGAEMSVDSLTCLCYGQRATGSEDRLASRFGRQKDL